LKRAEETRQNADAAKAVRSAAKAEASQRALQERAEEMKRHKEEVARLQKEAEDAQRELEKAAEAAKQSGDAAAKEAHLAALKRAEEARQKVDAAEGVRSAAEAETSQQADAERAAKAKREARKNAKEAKDAAMAANLRKHTEAGLKTLNPKGDEAARLTSEDPKGDEAARLTAEAKAEKQDAQEHDAEAKSSPAQVPLESQPTSLEDDPDYDSDESELAYYAGKLVKRRKTRGQEEIRRRSSSRLSLSVSDMSPSRKRDDSPVRDGNDDFQPDQTWTSEQGIRISVVSIPALKESFATQASGLQDAEESSEETEPAAKSVAPPIVPPRPAEPEEGAAAEAVQPLAKATAPQDDTSAPPILRSSTPTSVEIGCAFVEELSSIQEQPKIESDAEDGELVGDGAADGKTEVELDIARNFLASRGTTSTQSGDDAFAGTGTTGRNAADIAEEEAFTRTYNQSLAAREKQRKSSLEAGFSPKKGAPKPGWRDLCKLEENILSGNTSAVQTSLPSQPEVPEVPDKAIEGSIANLGSAGKATSSIPSTEKAGKGPLGQKEQPIEVQKEQSGQKVLTRVKSRDLKQKQLNESKERSDEKFSRDKKDYKDLKTKDKISSSASLTDRPNGWLQSEIRSDSDASAYTDTQLAKDGGVKLPQIVQSQSAPTLQHESMILKLQDELAAERLQRAEMSERVKDLENKLKESASQPVFAKERFGVTKPSPYRGAPVPPPPASSPKRTRGLQLPALRTVPHSPSPQRWLDEQAAAAEAEAEIQVANNRELSRADRARARVEAVQKLESQGLNNWKERKALKVARLKDVTVFRDSMWGSFFDWHEDYTHA
jgi:hypothetical protein